MSEQNLDDMIEDLKVKLEKQKKENKVVKFIPETNCNLTLLLGTFNINVLTIYQSYELLAYLKNIISDDITKDFTISSFSIHLWIKDIELKIEELQYKENLKDIRTKESKLDSLISTERKRKNLIEDIAKSLA
jgi:hypothetical protein